MDQVNLDKRQKRLIRNKESARKSRNRKKHYQEFLENKVKMLCHEASNLRNQIYKKSEEIEMNSKTEFDLKTRLLKHLSNAPSLGLVVQECAPSFFRTRTEWCPSRPTTCSPFSRSEETRSRSSWVSVLRLLKYLPFP